MSEHAGRIRLVVAMVFVALLILAQSSCGCQTLTEYRFTQEEYETTTGSTGIQLNVNNHTDGQQVSDATMQVSSWSVDPSEGASINELGFFTATQPGIYSVSAKIGEYGCTTTVVVKKGEAVAPGTGTQQDGQSRYAARLPATPCVSSSPDKKTSTLDTDVVFTVSGEDIRADTTSSGGTRTYTGKITPADGKFTITSENANVQVTGTITETGVSGVWRTTTSNGECTITFQGNRV